MRKHYGFIGLGLIGGSLARCLKKYNPQARISAYTRSEKTTTTALDLGIIDDVMTGPDDPMIRSCDMIFLCAPVGTNMDALEKMAPLLNPGCLVTDVGSVKTNIHEAARRLGATPQRCLVCEDVPMGILAGKRAGMKVAAMQEAYCADQADDVKRLADYYITDFRQLLDGTFEACGEQSGDA